MRENRPFIITFIGDACVLSASLLILSLFPNITERIGIYYSPLPTFLKVPFLSEVIMKVIISLILLIISYGYLSLKRWGYWLMVSFNVYFLVGSIISFQQSGQQSFYQNPIGIIIGLIFILPTIKYFDKVTFTR